MVTNPSHRVEIPNGVSGLELRADGHKVQLSNLTKPFWPELGLTKGHLVRYYAGVSSHLLPHLPDRAMVMKRYPDGAAGKFFFQKRAPEPRPEWIDTCSIEHGSGTVIDFPIVRDLASLLWIINLVCIDLTPWYARCDDINRFRLQTAPDRVREVGDLWQGHACWTVRL